MAMSVIRQDLEDFEAELQKVIDTFEKEHGLFIVDIKYDGFSKNIHYTFAGENFKFTKDNAY
jgi:hypothetical protein